MLTVAGAAGAGVGVGEVLVKGARQAWISSADNSASVSFLFSALSFAILALNLFLEFLRDLLSDAEGVFLLLFLKPIDLHLFFAIVNSLGNSLYFLQMNKRF